MEFNEITKEHFEAYEDVRKRGRFNMYDPNARMLTGLERDVYFAIMKHYSELMEKWPDVRK